jgi:hypothetical protein
MRVHLFACWLLASAALMAAGSERLTMAVSPAQSFAPTNVMIRLHVAPDAANRVLEVSADSGEYYRSSRVPLDGQDAPHTIVVELRNLPSGVYEVRGSIVDNAGHARASVRQQVIVLP